MPKQIGTRRGPERPYSYSRKRIAPTNKRLRRYANYENSDYPDAKFYRALRRKADAKGVTLHEDQAGALRQAYRANNRRKRKVKRAWAGRGY